MCVLLFYVFKDLQLGKTDVLKTCRKSHFSERKFEEMHELWWAKGIFGKTLILALLSSAVFRLQKCISDFF